MMSQFLNSHPLSFLILFHLLFFFIFTMFPAQSNNITNPNCSSYTCGNVSIHYPFWNNDTQSTTQFCGYEGFGINCIEDSERNISAITLGGESYYVRDIDYTLETIFIADYDVSEVVPYTCPRVHHNISIGTLPLNFRTYNANVSFHFDCNGCPSFAFEIPCLEKNARKACLDMSRGEYWDWNDYSCDQLVITTVSREFIDVISDLPTNFSSVLEKGFALQWEKMDGCKKCESSSGQCGNYKTTGFICFCSDGTISRDYCKGKSLQHLNSSSTHVSYT